MKKLVFVCGVLFGGLAHAQICANFKGMEENERYVVVQLAGANQQMTLEIANDQALEHQKLVEIAKIESTIRLLIEGETVLVKNSETYRQVEPVLSELIVQDKALAKLNREIELAIQKDESLKLTQVVEDIERVYSKELSLASQKVVASMLTWMKDADRLSQEWQVEQAELIRKLRLNEVSALSGLLMGIAQVETLNSEHLQNSRSARNRMELQKKDLESEIARAKARVANNQEKIIKNKPRIDRFPAYVADLRDGQDFCNRWTNSRPIKKEAF